MRRNLVYVGVLAIAAGLGALLVMPGRRPLDEADAPQPTESSAETAPPPSARPRQPAPSRTPGPPAYVRVDPESASLCGEGMVLVDGAYCPYVGHRCAVYEDEARDICASFAPEALCEGPLARRRFCIDILEYPNIVGALPAVWVSFDDAKRACSMEGKRICAAEEWELACEGTGMWPYPYGLVRDPDACNDRRNAPAPDPSKLDDPWSRSGEILRVDGRSRAGSAPACVSPFGARDLVGNVEEWVLFSNGNDRDKPFRTARKGGSWARGKGRCRPIEASEPGWYRAHDLGFRCCSDAKGAAPQGPAASSGEGRRKRILTPPTQ